MLLSLALDKYLHPLFPIGFCAASQNNYTAKDKEGRSNYNEKSSSFPFM
jgi:hypothetical protein